jgi:predicted nucleotidyltransferase
MRALDLTRKQSIFESIGSGDSYFSTWEREIHPTLCEVALNPNQIDQIFSTVQQNAGRSMLGRATDVVGAAKDKSSINCSHPKGFSQKAHCAGKKKNNESAETPVMEMVCEDCGMCETHGDNENLDEACWKGYHKEGNKKMFGKTYPNCVKNTNEEQEVEEGRENYNGLNILLQKDDEELFVKASAGGRELGHVLFVIDNGYLMPQDLEVEERFRGQGIAQTMYDYVKSKGYKIRRSGQQTDAGAGFWDKHRPEQNVWEEHHSETCPHCGGEMVSEELMNEKKDACYYKVKSRYKVWPSAYASGALVKCRKSGADSWGNGGKKNEGVAEGFTKNLDTDYFMNEGCGIFAVAMALTKPGSQIYIISNKSGESWSKSFPYEITHVFVSVPNKGQYDVHGQRSIEAMTHDFGLSKGDYGIKGPFDPKEFFTKFMGSSDNKPLYGTAKDVKELQQQIQNKQGVAESKQPGKPVVDAIQKVMPVAQEIWFHGSRATGSHRRNSDTDILVIVPDDLVGDQYVAVVRILQKLSSIFDNYDIQPTKAGTNIHRIAQEEGRLLWSNKQGVAEDQLDEKWTKKYKDSINCSNPKGFSQKAHCAGKQKNESSILEGINRVDESLHDWFNKEKWVRMDTKGKIKGPCAREPGEGKPKCLPQSKAHSLGKKGRASAAARKRREDPNPERSGKAINVNTKKKD